MEINKIQDDNPHGIKYYKQDSIISVMIIDISSSNINIARTEKWLMENVSVIVDKKDISSLDIDGDYVNNRILLEYESIKLECFSGFSSFKYNIYNSSQDISSYIHSEKPLKSETFDIEKGENISIEELREILYDDLEDYIKFNKSLHVEDLEI